MLPFIEIRRAQQEDHDDLADVFNNQSETVTEAYGEYFLAELIAAQSDHNKALVNEYTDVDSKRMRNWIAGYVTTYMQRRKD